MDKTNNLPIFLKDLADTINELDSAAEAINAQNFSDRIRKLSANSAGGKIAPVGAIDCLFGSHDYTARYVNPLYHTRVCTHCGEEMWGMELHTGSSCRDCGASRVIGYGSILVPDPVLKSLTWNHLCDGETWWDGTVNDIPVKFLCQWFQYTEYIDGETRRVSETDLCMFISIALPDNTPNPMWVSDWRQTTIEKEQNRPVDSLTLTDITRLNGSMDQMWEPYWGGGVANWPPFTESFITTNEYILVADTLDAESKDLSADSNFTDTVTGTVRHYTKIMPILLSSDDVELKIIGYTLPNTDVLVKLEQPTSCALIELSDLRLGTLQYLEPSQIDREPFGSYEEPNNDIWDSWKHVGFLQETIQEDLKDSYALLQFRIDKQTADVDTPWIKVIVGQYKKGTLPETDSSQEWRDLVYELECKRFLQRIQGTWEYFEDNQIKTISVDKNRLVWNGLTFGIPQTQGSWDTGTYAFAINFPNELSNKEDILLVSQWLGSWTYANLVKARRKLFPIEYLGTWASGANTIEFTVKGDIISSDSEFDYYYDPTTKLIYLWLPSAKDYDIIELQDNKILYNSQIYTRIE